MRGEQEIHDRLPASGHQVSIDLVVGPATSEYPPSDLSRPALHELGPSFLGSLVL